MEETTKITVSMNENAYPLPSGRDQVVGNMENNRARELHSFVDDLRKEWKTMWRERIDDEVRAEGVANRTFERLFVEQGLVLSATRNFKSPDFREILKKHMTSQDAERFNPHFARGGIRKFIRDHITSPSRIPNRYESNVKHGKQKRRLPLKNGGKGWLQLPRMRDLNERK